LLKIPKTQRSVRNLPTKTTRWRILLPKVDHSKGLIPRVHTTTNAIGKRMLGGGREPPDQKNSISVIA